jgi:rRNA maturation endonuclease Nob1
LVGVTNQAQRTMTNATTSEFYRETKWCESCQAQVRFLMSVNHSFCIDCGSKVRLFSREERTRFAESVQRHKYQAS